MRLKHFWQEMDGAQGGNVKMSRLSSTLPPDEPPTQSDKLLFDLSCRSRRVPVTDLRKAYRWNTDATKKKAWAGAYPHLSEGEGGLHPGQVVDLISRWFISLMTLKMAQSLPPSCHVTFCVHHFVTYLFKNAKTPPHASVKTFLQQFWRVSIRRVFHSQLQLVQFRG